MEFPYNFLQVRGNLLTSLTDLRANWHIIKKFIFFMNLNTTLHYYLYMLAKKIPSTLMFKNSDLKAKLKYLKKLLIRTVYLKEKINIL